MPKPFIGVRWWLGVAFAVVAATSTAIVVAQFSDRSENAFRNHGEKQTLADAQTAAQRAVTPATLDHVASKLQGNVSLRLFGPPGALIAGSGAPDGRAERVAGGYRVTGRWRYASGAHYASTFTANCIVTRSGAPQLDASGAPLIRAMAFPPGAVRILPSWQVSGMRGTGSHDFEVADVFVPEHHSFSVFTD